MTDKKDQRPAPHPRFITEEGQFRIYDRDGNDITEKLGLKPPPKVPDIGVRRINKDRA